MSMNNEIYLRLEKLMKTLGLSVNSGGITAAEMKAYATGVSLALNNMEILIKNLFADTADFRGLAMFLSAIGESSQKSENEARKLIYSAFTEGRGNCGLCNFEMALAEICKGISYSVDGNNITFSYSEKADGEFLKKLSIFIKNYLPAYCNVYLDGNGLTFEQWDKLEWFWYVLDSLYLPFSITDTLRS